MIGRIIIFALIAGLVYLNYTVPKVEDHQAALLEELQLGYSLPEAQQKRIWKNVDYSNFFVASFMKTTEGSTMISYGFLNKVRVVDQKWLEKSKKQIQSQQESTHY